MNEVIKLTEEQANAKIINYLAKIIDFVDANIKSLDDKYEFNRSWMYQGSSIKELKVVTKSEYKDLLKMALISEGYPVFRILVSNTNSKYKYIGYYQLTDFKIRGR